MTEKRYSSNAERQAAYRRRKGYEPDQLEVRTQENQPASDTSWSDPEILHALSEELYVQHHLAQTGIYAGSFYEPEKVRMLPARLDRACSYARWRWQAFHAGEVASL